MEKRYTEHDTMCPNTYRIRADYNKTEINQNRVEYVQIWIKSHWNLIEKNMIKK